MTFRFRLSLFFKEAILFVAALVLGVYTAFVYSKQAGAAPAEITGGFSSSDAFILAAIGIGMILIMRSRRASAWAFRIFLGILFFTGANIVLGAFVPAPWDLFGALIVLVAILNFRNVFFHNLGIIFGIAGVGALLGLTITPHIGLILLVAMSFYDIVAVYFTRHMVVMAERMIEGGAISGFLIPLRFRDFFAGKNQATQTLGQNFMILGSGDIGLPLIFACSLITTSLASAIFVSIFSVIGLFFTHLIFLNQRTKRAMAALPPIATMSIIGYLISFYING